MRAQCWIPSSSHCLRSILTCGLFSISGRSLPTSWAASMSGYADRMAPPRRRASATSISSLYNMTTDSSLDDGIMAKLCHEMALLHSLHYYYETVVSVLMLMQIFPYSFSLLCKKWTITYLSVGKWMSIRPARKYKLHADSEAILRSLYHTSYWHLS